MDNKPTVKLIGQNGNIFNLLAIARRALVHAGNKSKSTEMINKVTSSHSYSEALAIMSDYVNIR